jgi:long-chain acyl-CoA synthetase
MTSIQEALGRLWNAADNARMLQCDGQWVTWGEVRALTERIDQAGVSPWCSATAWSR